MGFFFFLQNIKVHILLKSLRNAFEHPEATQKSENKLSYNNQETLLQTFGVAK